MKKIIFTLMALSLCFNISTASNVSDAPKSREWYYIHNKMNTEIERSLDVIEAVIDYSTKTIEIEAYEIGVADIYLVNSKNQIVDWITVDTELSPLITLDLPEQKGKYTLAIWSRKFIGEGEFTI